MARENQELRTAVQHNSLTVTCDPETEPVLDVRSLPQRPVSMYETRESLRAQVRPINPLHSDRRFCNMHIDNLYM